MITIDYQPVSPASQERLKAVLNRLAWDMTVTFSQKTGLSTTFWRPDGHTNPQAHACWVEVRSV